MITRPILLTGGTGTLGRHVLPMLRDAGRSVRVLSRRSRESADDGVEYVTGDLHEDTGADAAVAGVHTVLHLAGAAKGDDETTRNLVRAAAGAGVRHLVCISVIGADTVPLGYLRAKLGAERAVIDSGLPWTILRAAQFHDLALTMAKGMTRLPVVPVPSGLRLQPVDVRDVAARLTELALGLPAGRVPDLAGPTVYPMADLLRGYLTASAKRRPLVPFPLPGKAGRAYRSGANLTLEGADTGRRTWEDFLAEQVG
ncbi:SDR family oxidoreductase [Streptomyces sp. NBC_01198]|uniref:SDR family oxidoreductase n=1 Tax=Streptomyces sp. NBC_01198 TaxID=2903769 RepID=UPI002E0F46CC|nr:NAD(P)H-binding protein [Streptomyces sp. NBC_01198]